MNELDLQSKFLINFLCEWPDGLRYNEAKANTVSPLFFITKDLWSFTSECSLNKTNDKISCASKMPVLFIGTSAILLIDYDRMTACPIRLSISVTIKFLVRISVWQNCFLWENNNSWATDLAIITLTPKPMPPRRFCFRQEKTCR